jgi:hypothetical protein
MASSSKPCGLQAAGILGDELVVAKHRGLKVGVLVAEDVAVQRQATIQQRRLGADGDVVDGLRRNIGLGAAERREGHRRAQIAAGDGAEDQHVVGRLVVQAYPARRAGLGGRASLEGARPIGHDRAASRQERRQGRIDHGPVGRFDLVLGHPRAGQQAQGVGQLEATVGEHGGALGRGPAMVQAGGDRDDGHGAEGCRGAQLGAFTGQLGLQTREDRRPRRRTAARSPATSVGIPASSGP